VFGEIDPISHEDFEQIEKMNLTSEHKSKKQQKIEDLKPHSVFYNDIKMNLNNKPIESSKEQKIDNPKINQSITISKITMSEENNNKSTPANLPSSK